MHPKALQVMSGVAVLIADGACNAFNDLESIRKRCNHSSSKGDGGSSSASSIVVAAVFAVVAQQWV
jgi:hypothetical protein